MQQARLLDVANDDLLVVNAARVSFAKRRSLFDAQKDPRLLGYLAGHRHWTPYAHPQFGFVRVVGDRELSRWLLNRQPGCETILLDTGKGINRIAERGSLWFWHENHHMLPAQQQECVRWEIWRHAPHAAEALGITIPDCLTVEPPQRPALTCQPLALTALDDDWLSAGPLHERARIPTLTFHMRASMPVRTQCFKHKYGFCENETSRRYVSDMVEFFDPGTWHEAPRNAKQGSGAALPTFAQVTLERLYQDHLKQSRDLYYYFIDNDVAPEEARFILPQATLTEWYWTGSLAAFARFCNQRFDAHAQSATRELAGMVSAQIAERYPQTWKRLLDV